MAPIRYSKYGVLWTTEASIRCVGKATYLKDGEGAFPVFHDFYQAGHAGNTITLALIETV